MKTNMLLPIIGFIAGAILMMVVMNRCNSADTSKLQKDLQAFKDSTKAVVDSNNVLRKETVELNFDKILHDSLNGKTIDSLHVVIKTIKTRYYNDTAKFKKTIISLQDAFNNRDSAKAQAAIDSLIIEARSANWSATNLFYQYDEMDSVWKLQKGYDDSVYHQLYLLDSAKDNRFDALLRINNQQGVDLETALKEIQTLKKGKKFWFLTGAIVGALTNFIHK